MKLILMAGPSLEVVGHYDVDCEQPPGVVVKVETSVDAHGLSHDRSFVFNHRQRPGVFVYRETTALQVL